MSNYVPSVTLRQLAALTLFENMARDTMTLEIVICILTVEDAKRVINVEIIRLKVLGPNGVYIFLESKVGAGDTYRDDEKENML